MIRTIRTTHLAVSAFALIAVVLTASFALSSCGTPHSIARYDPLQDAELAQLRTSLHVYLEKKQHSNPYDQTFYGSFNAQIATLEAQIHATPKDTLSFKVLSAFKSNFAILQTADSIGDMNPRFYLRAEENLEADLDAAIVWEKTKLQEPQ